MASTKIQNFHESLAIIIPMNNLPLSFKVNLTEKTAVIEREAEATQLQSSWQEKVQ